MAKNRFKDLRTVFSKQHKKRLVSSRSGAGTAELYEPRWEFYNQLRFLLETRPPATSQSNLSLASSSDSSDINVITNQSEEVDQVSDVVTSLADNIPSPPISLDNLPTESPIGQQENIDADLDLETGDLIYGEHQLNARAAGQSISEQPPTTAASDSITRSSTDLRVSHASASLPVTAHSSTRVTEDYGTRATRPRGGKKTRKVASEGNDDNLENLKRSFLESAASALTTKDRFENFGEYVASTLRTLSPRSADLAMVDIQQTFIRYKHERPGNSTAVQSVFSSFTPRPSIFGVSHSGASLTYEGQSVPAFLRPNIPSLNNPSSGSQSIFGDSTHSAAQLFGNTVPYSTCSSGQPATEIQQNVHGNFGITYTGPTTEPDSLEIARLAAANLIN